MIMIKIPIKAPAQPIIYVNYIETSTNFVNSCNLMNFVILNEFKGKLDQKSRIILGPLLFLTYVNDLPRSVSSQVLLFADDTKIMRSISILADHVQLQTDLDNLHS